MKKFLNGLGLTMAMMLSSTAYASAPKKVLIVLTSHDKLGDTNNKTGFWLPELTHPYYELVDKGVHVEVVSIRGGIAPIDEKSLKEKDKSIDRFLSDAKLMSKVLTSRPLSSVDPLSYDAIIFSGGSGAMWDFPNDASVNKVAISIFERGGVVAAICHGPAALVDMKLSNGKYLVAGKKISAFTNEEEELLGQTKILPFLLQNKLSERGAKHIAAVAWQENVVVDGRLVTGQNPNSAKKVAQEVLSILRKNTIID